jgi:hypothetical protein
MPNARTHARVHTHIHTHANLLSRAFQSVIVMSKTQTGNPLFVHGTKNNILYMQASSVVARYVGGWAAASLLQRAVRACMCRQRLCTEVVAGKKLSNCIKAKICRDSWTKERESIESTISPRLDSRPVQEDGQHKRTRVQEEITSLLTPRHLLHSISERDMEQGAVTMVHTHSPNVAYTALAITTPSPTLTYALNLPPSLKKSLGSIAATKMSPRHNNAPAQGHHAPNHAHGGRNSSQGVQGSDASPSDAREFGYSAVMTPRTAVRTIDGFLLSPRDHAEADRRRRKSDVTHVR